MYADERIDAANRFMGRRPLALWAMLYCVGSLAGYYCHVPLGLWAAFAGLVGLAFVIARQKVWLFVLAVAIGGLWTGYAAVVPDAEAMDGVVIEGYAASEPNWNGERAVVRIANPHIDGEPHGREIRAYFYGAQIDVRMGDRLSFAADTWVPQGQRNPHGFDFRAWLWTQGSTLCASGEPETLAVSTPEGWTYLSAIGGIRTAIGARIDALFPVDAPLVRALVIGDRTALDEGMVDDFRRAGLAHLLAISGLHVSGLAIMLEWLLRLFGCRRKWAIWISLLALLAYSAVLGFMASVVRSALMFLFLRGSRLSGRPPDALTGLAAAFLVIAVPRPLSVADAGFQMSFGAVLGLLLLTEPVSALVHAPRTTKWASARGPAERARFVWAQIMVLITSSIAAQLILLPVLAQVFGTVTPLSPLINIPAIPLSTLMMPPILFKLVTGAAWFSLPDVMLSWLAGLANIGAQVPGSGATLPAWPAWLVTAYLAVCVMASPYMKTGIRWRKLCLLMLPLLALTSMLCARLALPGGLNIAFVDVGQADASVIRAEGTVYACDLGKENGAAVDYLVRTGQRPKAVFLTHPHEDHCGGLKGLLDVMPPEVIYIPDCWDDVEPDGGVAEQMAAARDMGVRIEKIAAGDVIALSEHITAEVIHPAAGYRPKSGNGASLVIEVKYGEGSALITGDLPSNEEAGFFPDVTVLKAAHHGSGSSSSERMLAMTAPSAMVVSVGRNGYGHPAPRVIEAAQRAGAEVYRTDEGGFISADIREDGTVHMYQFLEDAS